MGSYKTNVFACWKDHLWVLHSNVAGSTLIWTGTLDPGQSYWQVQPIVGSFRSSRFVTPIPAKLWILCLSSHSKALNAQWLVSLFTTLPGPSAPSYHQLRSNTSSLPRSPELPAIMTAQLSSRAPLSMWKTSYKCRKFYSCLMVVIAFQQLLRW